MTRGKYRTAYGARGRPSYYWQPARNTDQRRAMIGRTTLIPLIAVSAAIIVIGMILIGFFSSYFNVKKINVSGTGKYTEEELIEASGLECGIKLYRADTGKARKKILESFTGLYDVKVRKVLPSEIVIEPIYEVPKYYTEVTGEYFTLSESLRVLERLGSAKQCENAGLIYVSLPDVKRAVTGEVLTLFSGDENYITQFLKVYSESSFYSDADRIYVKGKFDISVVKKDVYRVMFGSFHDCALKIKMAEKVLDDGGYRGTCGVILDVSDVSSASVGVDKSAKIQ